MRLYRTFCMGLAALLGSASATHASSAYLGAGVLFQNLITATTSESGGSSFTGAIYLPALQLSARFPMDGMLGSWGLAPSVYYTPLEKSHTDDVSKRLLIVQLPLYFAVDDKLSWKAGPGFQIYTLSGPGGSVELNNGTSTATFYRPSGSVSTTALLLTGGISWNLDSSWKLDVDLLMPGILTTRRAFTLAVSMNWGFL